MEFAAAERSLIMTNVYHHFALLHIVVSKLERKKKKVWEATGAVVRANNHT